MGTKQTTMLQALNVALADALAADPKVLVFGEDVADEEGGGVLGVTKGLSAKAGKKIKWIEKKIIKKSKNK